MTVIKFNEQMGRTDTALCSRNERKDFMNFPTSTKRFCYK